jgi:hypothetical protein
VTDVALRECMQMFLHIAFGIMVPLEPRVTVTKAVEVMLAFFGLSIVSWIILSANWVSDAAAAREHVVGA